MQCENIINIVQNSNSRAYFVYRKPGDLFGASTAFAVICFSLKMSQNEKMLYNWKPQAGRKNTRTFCGRDTTVNVLLLKKKILPLISLV